MLKRNLLLTVIILLLVKCNFAQSVGIGTLIPDASAQLDISSSTKGMLIPRLTAAQRSAITTPATGLLVYQTDADSSFFCYNGIAWVKLLSTESGWQLSGNSATSNGQFIGTTDDRNIVFKRHNVKSGWIDTTNTSFGLAGLFSVTTAKYNTAVGTNALSGDHFGDANSALGYGALAANIGGYSNTAVGVNSLTANQASGNTAIGAASMAGNSTGTLNTAIGTQSLFSNTTGNGNTATGYNSLYANSTGTGNTSTGFYSLVSNTSGNNNTATGFDALNGNVTGNNNAAIGAGALLGNTSGNSNVAVGVAALHNNTSGSNMVAVGDSALYNNGYLATLSFDGIQNTAVGSKALFSNTIGFSNTAVGYNAMRLTINGGGNTAVGSQSLERNTTGISNSAIGNQALRDNITGIENAAFGTNALVLNKSGSNNTALGAYALQFNTEGYSNVAIGSGSLQMASGANIHNIVAIGDSALFNNGLGETYISAGRENTAIGSKALFANTRGWFLTATGFESMKSNTTGSNNSAYGHASLTHNTTGNSNTAVGMGASYFNSTGTYNTSVGYSALSSTVNGERNVAVGAGAHSNNISGSDNTAVGYRALSRAPLSNAPGGYGNTAVGAYSGRSNNGFNNTFIGDSTDILNWYDTLHNATAIGHNARVGINNAVVLGDLNATVGIGTFSPSQAGLVVNKTVGGYLHAMFGSNTTGVAIESNWPGIGFNAYYNSGRKFISNGYAGHINVAQDNGTLRLIIHGNGTANNPVITEKGVMFVNGSGTTGAFNPYVDNVYTLGSATNRWTTIYATNGLINTSDRQEKKNIHALTYGLKEVMQLQPVRFQWKNISAGEQWMLGLLAQDVKPVIPELVAEVNDKLGLRSAELIPVLIKAIQEQQIQIDELNARLNQLIKN